MKKLLSLLVAVVMVFALAAAASAAGDLSVGGTLYFRFANGITNSSKVDFFRISVSTGRSFGNASAYLALQTQTYTTLPPHETGTGTTLPHNPSLKAWNIWNYGYDYNFSNGITAGIIYHTEGVTLSDGRLASDWDWLHVHAFNEKHVLKLTGQPLAGLKAGLYLEPVSMDYIVKAEYAAGNFRVGAGYTNAAALVSNNRTYNVYAELMPFEGAKLYLDYLADGKFIADASLVVGPVTVAALYSNEDKAQYGYRVFKAETADINVTYAVSPWATVTGGVVYDTVDAEITKIYGKYDFGRGYLGVSQDLENSATHVYGGYKIDGANTLQGDYNVSTGDWWVAMAIGLW